MHTLITPLKNGIITIFEYTQYNDSRTRDTQTLTVI